ncbi:MAG: ATP-binding protein, partial [Leptonema sp. (in: Bacteria)]|nr:ATP-binding protein [Leptonema sp. (in: bacteria)]
YEIIALLKTNQHLNKSLRQYIRHMNQMHTVVSKSEEKYRRLIEETKEIILTLSEAGIITSANSSVQTELGISKEALIGKPFEHLLDQRIDTVGGFSQQFTVDRVREFYVSGNSLSIRAPLFAENKKSHIFFDLKFEKIHTRKDTEIFVKASAVEEDPTLKYLIKETLSFEMENDLFIIEDMVRRLIDDLPRFLDEYEINMIRIGLREVIVNAIEHGNLGISYTEKTDLLHTGNYQEEIQRRLEIEKHSRRRVKVSINLTPRRVRYRITDEGGGFDHSKFGHSIEIDEPTVSLHGRGIFITRNAFTKVLYNHTGNSVLLVRDFVAVAEESHI